jgi:hypothetical protein
VSVAAVLTRLTPVARTVAWPPLLAGVLACVAVIGVGSLDGSPLGRWPGLGALALCTGAAFLLDDAAAVTVARS